MRQRTCNPARCAPGFLRPVAQDQSELQRGQVNRDSLAAERQRSEGCLSRGHWRKRLGSGKRPGCSAKFTSMTACVGPSPVREHDVKVAVVTVPVHSRSACDEIINAERHQIELRALPPQLAIVAGRPDQHFAQHLFGVRRNVAGSPGDIAVWAN